MWGVFLCGYPYGLGSSLPLLDLVEALEERDRDEDDDGLLSVTDLNL